jgi:hypothetical protein
MQKKRVFISSVQSEFERERQMLFEYMISDAMLGKFFEPFVFENVPASNYSPTAVFLNEVEQCDIYLGIFGENYGFEDKDGISPTEREFDCATKNNKIRFVYVKQAEQRNAAVDFVLSKINLYVGDRSKNVTVDVEYEIPKQAITEAVVNAVCHRDYTSNGSVQVMLFADRVEVSNPGSLPYGLTIEQLYSIHNSIPANPLLAESMYLRGTIERMGTGTEDMTNLCIEKG